MSRCKSSRRDYSFGDAALRKKNSLIHQIGKKRVRYNQEEILCRLQEKVRTDSTKDEEAVKLQREERKQRERQEASKIVQGSTAAKYQNMLISINTIRKQMIFEEICLDIMRVQRIMKDMIALDKALSLSEEQVKKRQCVRQEFSDFIIYEIKRKYANQLYLFIDTEDLDRRIDLQMSKKPEDYAIEARSILLKISLLMMQNNITLKLGAGQDWISILSGQPDIAILVNELCNLMVEQMAERESLITFPLEEMEKLLEVGE